MGRWRWVLDLVTALVLVIYTVALIQLAGDLAELRGQQARLRLNLGGLVERLKVVETDDAIDNQRIADLELKLQRLENGGE